MKALQRRLRRGTSKKGFTLIELIVVIVIVGILAAVMIPKFTGFTDKARSTQALVAAKQVGTTIDAYFAEHADWPLKTVAAELTEISTLSGVAEGEIATMKANGEFSVTVTVDGVSFTAGRADSTSEVVMQ